MLGRISVTTPNAFLILLAKGEVFAFESVRETFELLAANVACLSLAKIDAKGYELSVLKGMTELFRRDLSTLIAEDNCTAIRIFLDQFSYQCEKLTASSNVMLTIGGKSMKRES